MDRFQLETAWTHLPTPVSDWRREPQIIGSADRAGWRCPKFGGVVFTPHERLFTPRERFARASTRSRRNMPHPTVFCVAS